MLIDIQYAHVGNNFTLTFQEPAQRDIQARFDVTSGVWARSFDESIFKRPTHSVDATMSYFLPATFGGDHAFKVGYRWRTARGETISHTGGNAQARYANVAGANPNCALRFNDAGAAVYDCNADLFRDGYTNYNLGTNALYVQDTFTVKRFTLNLGVRWDRADRRSAAGPAFRPIRSSRRSCRRLTFPALTAASCGTTFRRASA